MTAACAACSAAPIAAELASEAGPTVTLSVPGLSCAACIRNVENTLNALPNVRGARVNLTLKRVTVDTCLPAVEIADVLADTGYQAYPYDAESVADTTDAVGRDLLLRLGVAGFAMMNVMLLSVAVWSGATDATRDLFHLVSAAIALPASIFSAQPFFAKAWTALRVWRLNMDVPISLAILLAAGMSLFESLNGGAHAYFDAALSLTFFLLIGRFLEHRTRAVARSAAQDLSVLEVRDAVRKFGNGYESVPTAKITPGDVLLVATGMRVPVDGALADNEALTDRSFLTGESDPVASNNGASLHAGEINLGAPFHLHATAVGEDTSIRRMARLVETAENARTSYASLADQAAKVYAPAVHLLAAIAFTGWILATGDLRHALNIAIAVLIITCPCALGLAVPAVATAAIGKLYQMGFLVKSGTALERLAQSDAVIFDKTGTLTVPGINLEGHKLSTEQQSVALALAQASRHPVSVALVEALGGVEAVQLRDVTEVRGKGINASWNGKPVSLGSPDWLGVDGSGIALRIGTEVRHIARFDVPRDNAIELVAALKTLGRKVGILSGDSREKTSTLAAELNVDRWFGETTPQDKHDYVVQLHRDGYRVAMVGDGINDAAALSAAHVSMAPGSALDAARNAADVIMLRPGLGDVPRLFQIATNSVRLSRQNFAIALAYNAVAVPIAVAGFATPLIAALAMSASSITVLLNAMRVRNAK